MPFLPFKLIVTLSIFKFSIVFILTEPSFCFFKEIACRMPMDDAWNALAPEEDSALSASTINLTHRLNFPHHFKCLKFSLKFSGEICLFVF